MDAITSRLATASLQALGGLRAPERPGGPAAPRVDGGGGGGGGGEEATDRVSISAEARRAHEADRKSGAGRELTPEEEAQVQELKARDREVRAHEQAHAAAAGELAAGGPQYEYQVGPDGKRYAVGGHVDITLREGNTPQESLRLANQAKAAALAPAEPSSQDRAVAAKATAMAVEAKREIQEERAAQSGADGGRIDVLA